MDLNVFRFRNRIFGIELFLFLVLLLIYLVLQIGSLQWGWDEFIINLLSNINIALLAGLGAGLVFEISIRKEQAEEILALVNLKKQMADSGIREYYSDFRSIDLQGKMRSASIIDMYFTYGRTLINSLFPILEDRMKNPNVKLNIYFCSEENPFLVGLGNLWGKYGDLYNKENLAKKIKEVRETLSGLVSKLESRRELEATVGIFGVNYHPFTYSFYRFDNEIILCPTKVTEDKNFRPISIIVSEQNKTDIFHWCLDELEFIRKQEGALTTIYKRE
jgi:hypothetical protein